MKTKNLPIHSFSKIKTKIKSLVLYCIPAFLFFSSTEVFGQVNGTNVVKVDYQGGSFVQTSPGKWKENNFYDFTETGRDEWSVYMIDASRDIPVQLDLYKKEIIIYWDRSNRATLYAISSVSSTANSPGSSSSNGGPAGYTKCADEGGKYTFNNTVDVAYGSGSTFVYKSGLNGTITFDNATFGDPAPGVGKAGYYKNAAGGGNSSTNNGPAGYTKCADEGGKYTFNNMVDVAYGSGSTFVFKSGLNGTITFDNATFGDPAPGVGKAGYYKNAAGGNANNNGNGGSNNPKKIDVNAGGKVGDILRYLNPADEIAVLKWISDEVTDSKVEYCWKRSHPRYTEGLTRCPAGTEKDGLICYTPCRSDYKAVGPVCWHNCPEGYTNNGPTCFRGADTKSAPSQLGKCPDGYTNVGLTCYRGPSTYAAGSTVADCPSGYTNMGATCYKGPSTYAKGCTTVFKKYPCESGYTDNGCFCGRGADSKGMESMTCPSGRFRKGGRCYVECQPGYTNNGEFCGRGADSKGMSSMSCPSDYFQGADARCHKNCPAGYTNTGETCYRGPSTLSNESYGRGAGSPMVCKEGLIHNGAGLCFEPCPQGYVASSDADPVCWKPCPDNQPVSCGAGCANSAMACAQETFNQVDAVVQVALNIISLGKTAQFTAARKATTAAIKAGDRVAAKAAARLAIKELANGFEQLTTKKVVKQLAEQFAENASKWVMEEYAAMLLQTANTDPSEEDLWELAALDPTGIAEVVHAFYKPLCSKGNPFPTVTPIQR